MYIFKIVQTDLSTSKVHPRLGGRGGVWFPVVGGGGGVDSSYIWCSTDVRPE